MHLLCLFQHTSSNFFCWNVGIGAWPRVATAHGDQV
jgi:hypothetical protein